MTTLKGAPTDSKDSLRPIKARSMRPRKAAQLLPTPPPTFKLSTLVWLSSGPKHIREPDSEQVLMEIGTYTVGLRPILLDLSNIRGEDGCFVYTLRAGSRSTFRHALKALTDYWIKDFDCGHGIWGQETEQGPRIALSLPSEDPFAFAFYPDIADNGVDDDLVSETAHWRIDWKH